MCAEQHGSGEVDPKRRARLDDLLGQLRNVHPQPPTSTWQTLPFSAFTPRNSLYRIKSQLHGPAPRKSCCLLLPAARDTQETPINVCCEKGSCAEAQEENHRGAARASLGFSGSISLARLCAWEQTCAPASPKPLLSVECRSPLPS